MELLEEQVMDSNTKIINEFLQLGIPTEHNGRTDTFPTYHIIQSSKINLVGIHQEGLLQLSPSNQSIKRTNIFIIINAYGNGTSRSI